LREIEKAAQNQEDKNPMAFITKDSTNRGTVQFLGKQGLSLMLFVLSYLLAGTSTARAQEANFPAPVSVAVVLPQIDSGAIPDSPLPANRLFARAPASISSMNLQQKLWYAAENSFGLPSMIFAAAGAGANQAQNLYPEFRQGAGGYGRYYWHSYADQAVDSYVVNFVLADTLHTDPRYHPLRTGGAWARTKHAGASLLMTHTDSGQRIFNTPQVLGSGIAASISSFYYPERDRTASLVTQRWASNLAGDGLMMVLREFTPEFIRAGRHLCASISFSAVLCEDRTPADH
jgi:hypothetical protein